MTKFYIIAFVFAAIGLLIKLFGGKEGVAPKYQYKHKNFLMSPAEHECYDALTAAVGNKYYIFPQVHLSAIIDNKVVGQNWKAAFSHINQKSVDYVLCDKAYIAPKLAIELDDRTHEEPSRRDRDVEVERILEEAQLPLLRLENHGSFSPEELANKINSLLGSHANP